jgi:hypothetical protein
VGTLLPVDLEVPLQRPAVAERLPYWLGFGLQYDQKVVLSTGMATRNLGATLAPLMAADRDQRAIVMVVLAFSDGSNN